MSKRRNHAFTQRETEILALVDQGLTNKDIAKRLHISLGTVMTHIRSIRKVTGLHECPKTLPSIIQSIFSEETKRQEDMTENEVMR
jgi:DNA-binding NarL/FixJ family response regulator